jgi:hypothetical protein
LLTHDRDTLPGFAYDRVRAGQSMPGVFAVSDLMPVGQAVEEILLAVECLPLRSARISSDSFRCEFLQPATQKTLRRKN